MVWNGVGFVELDMERLTGLGIRLIRGLVLIMRRVDVDEHLIAFGDYFIGHH